jgi:hypothetical protein
VAPNSAGRVALNSAGRVAQSNEAQAEQSSAGPAAECNASEEHYNAEPAHFAVQTWKANRGPARMYSNEAAPDSPGAAPDSAEARSLVSGSAGLWVDYRERVGHCCSSAAPDGCR